MGKGCRRARQGESVKDEGVAQRGRNNEGYRLENKGILEKADSILLKSKLVRFKNREHSPYLHEKRAACAPISNSEYCESDRIVVKVEPETNQPDIFY